MKLNTTFWTKEVYSFNNLLYINAPSNNVIYKTDLNDAFASYLFFKNVAKFVKSNKVRKSILDDSDDCYQFAIIENGEIIPIKWFDLVIDESNIISHDIAFETTLIKRNGQHIGFGHFPMYYWERNIRIPMYRELNIKARVYRYIANQIKNTVFRSK